MKDNLEAKFYSIVLKATQKEFSDDIQKIYFVVDNTIDNPSNTNAIDCQSFYKESQKNTK